MGRRILNSWIMCLCACLLLAGTAGAAEPSAGTAVSAQISSFCII